MAIAYSPQMRRRDEDILRWYEEGHSYEVIRAKVLKKYKQSLGVQADLGNGRIYQILAKTGARRAA